MTREPDRSTADAWARFRFSVVGSLLSSPPAHGELKAALQALAARTWSHPVPEDAGPHSTGTSATTSRAVSSHASPAPDVVVGLCAVLLFGNGILPVLDTELQVFPSRLRWALDVRFQIPR